MARIQFVEKNFREDSLAKIKIAPAKVSDPRAQAYIDKHGNSSWEVDALDPNVLVDLIEEEFDGVIDRSAMEAVVKKEDAQRDKFKAMLAREKW